MTRPWLLLVLALGCDNRDGAPFGLHARSKPGSAAPGSAATAPVAPTVSSAGWPSKKRTPRPIIVEGIPVSVDVPEGLPRDPQDTVDWNDDRPGHDADPKVFMSTIDVSIIRDLDRAKYHATLDARLKTWVRAEERPDGWALTNAEPNMTVIEAIRYMRVGDMFVRCKATQHAEGPIPNHAAARALLEAICDSMKPQ